MDESDIARAAPRGAWFGDGGADTGGGTALTMGFGELDLGDVSRSTSSQSESESTGGATQTNKRL